MPDPGPATDIAALLAGLETAAEEHRLGKDVGPTRQQYLVRYAAKAIRRLLDEVERLQRENTALRDLNVNQAARMTDLHLEAIREEGQ